MSFLFHRRGSMIPLTHSSTQTSSDEEEGVGEIREEAINLGEEAAVDLKDNGHR